MTSVDLTIGERDFGIEFDMVDETTGAAFDLTLFTNIRLFITTTDFATQIVPAGIILLPTVNPEDGVLIWDVQLSHIPTPAGQYYGLIKMEDTVSSEIRKGRRFNIRSLRSVSP